jgi:hypothetical protein
MSLPWTPYPEPGIRLVLVGLCDAVIPLLEDVLGSKLRLLVLFLKNKDRNECTCLSNAKSVDIANY